MLAECSIMLIFQIIWKVSSADDSYDFYKMQNSSFIPCSEEIFKYILPICELLGVFVAVVAVWFFAFIE